jgi:hypothetical protein
MAQISLGDNPRLVVAGPYGVAQTGTTFAALDVPAGTFIPPYGVSVIVTTLLDGGSPSIEIGDADTDGWVATEDITETTAATYTGTATNSAISPTGKYYASADTLDCILAASLTAGVFYVTALMYDVEDVI